MKLENDYNKIAKISAKAFDSKGNLVITVCILEDIKTLQAELETYKAATHGDSAIILIEQLQAELKSLKEFARRVIEIEFRSMFDPDGGDIQDLAEKTGLIQQHIATEDDIDDSSDFEVGDTIFKFSEFMKEDKP